MTPVISQTETGRSRGGFCSSPCMRSRMDNFCCERLFVLCAQMEINIFEIHFWASQAQPRWQWTTQRSEMSHLENCALAALSATPYSHIHRQFCENVCFPKLCTNCDKLYERSERRRTCITSIRARWDDVRWATRAERSHALPHKFSIKILPFNGNAACKAAPCLTVRAMNADATHNGNQREMHKRARLERI